MGEAGAEAILPLARGRGWAGWGVAGGGGAAPGPCGFSNVTTPDAPSFRKSEGAGDGMLARAVSRGTRSL